MGGHELFPHPRRPVPPTLEEFLPLIGLELRRARRYERQLSALALDLEAYPLLPRGRATDIVAVSPDHQRVVVVLPETGPEGAARYAERLKRDIGLDLLGASSFPDDALTLDVLLRLVLES